MKQLILALCLIMTTTIGHAKETYSTSTDVSGMVNVNAFTSGLMGNINVGVNATSDQQDSIEYTFEVTAKPIKRGKPYLKNIDQIHYALAGLSTNTSMLTSEQLPWRKTIAGNGIMVANLVVAYDRSINKVTHRKSYNLLKNTKIVLAFYQGDKLLKKMIYKPSVDNPTAELKHNFEGMQSNSGVAVGGSVSIGNVSIEDGADEARVHEPVDDEEFSDDYTFEVIAKPIMQGKAYLKKVERLRYRLNYRGGVNMDTITQAELPWRHTITRSEVSEAFVSTGFINSLDPFFNKKQARRGKNTILVLNIYNGNELVSSKEYQPNKDNTEAELEVEFKED